MPVPNTVDPATGAQFPGSRERSTTIVTFLYFRPGTSFAAQTAGARQYARQYAPSHFVGVTGVVPATYQQGVIIAQRLPWVEVATVAAIWLIVGFFFLSLGAPLATLLCAATSYLLVVRVVAWVTQQMHVPLPPDVEPVLIVLLLGVTTDYSVFFLSGMRNRLAEGIPRLQAARLTTAEYAPIILAAGVLVAAATGSLALAKIELIRALGPGPRGHRRHRDARRADAGACAHRDLRQRAVLARTRLVPQGPPDRARGPPRGHPHRPASAAGVAVARPGAARPGRDGQAGRPDHRRGVRRRDGRGRPEGHQPAARCPADHARCPDRRQEARAQAAASQGFAAGILSPTEVLLIGPGVTGQTAALDRLQHALARQPGVAGVIGPGTVRSLLGGFSAQAAAAGVPNPMLAKSGNAARFGVIGRTDPLGPTAVSQVEALQRRLPGLARAAGLTGVRIEVGGETAATGEAITSTTDSITSFAPLMLIVTLVLLVLFLSALIAPLYLLAASILALFATLGVTVWVFQHQLGADGLVYYVPFTVGVLLISLGADYNVFVVGRIWEEARRRPLRDAIAVAGSQASRAITVAGITLAASFALLAIIPLQQFREVAVAMAAGIVIDTVIARSLLVPALVALFGRAGMWPGRRRSRGCPVPMIGPGGRRPPIHGPAGAGRPRRSAGARHSRPAAAPRPSITGRVAGLWSRAR